MPTTRIGIFARDNGRNGDLTRSIRAGKEKSSSLEFENASQRRQMKKKLSDDLEAELVQNGIIFAKAGIEVFITVDECMALADFLAEAMPRLHEIIRRQND